MLTRKQTAHQLFGNPCDLPPTQLPTVGDVLRLIGKYKLEDVEVTNPKFANKNEALEKAVKTKEALFGAIGAAGMNLYHSNFLLLRVDSQV